MLVGQVPDLPSQKEKAKPDTGFRWPQAALL
jgi:hypothetical protein